MSETNGTTNRMQGRQGTGNTRVAPETKPGRKPGKATSKPAAGRSGRGLLLWAYSGVALCLGLSAALNGMAFSERAPVAAAGWALGVAVPGLVLILSRVAAGAWERGWRRLAYAGAGAVLAMLALSVQHMAVSISRLTGEDVVLAGLMAVAVDVGLVVCELATVRK